MLACGVQLPRETWDLNVIIEALLQTIIIAMHPPPLPRGMVNGARYGFCNLFVVIARSLIASLLTRGHDPVVYGIKIIFQCLIKILPLLRLPSTANSFDNRTFPLI